MIVSHERRFVFLKTSKTAGTSMEIGLSRFCGPGDVITPVYGPDEEMRRRLGYRSPQNHLASPLEYRARDIATLVVRRTPKLRYYNHMPASEAKPRLGDPLWDTYFTFCFERNPWDRVVSQYFWHMGRRERSVPFSSYLEGGGTRSLVRKGRDVYTIDGEIAVDMVYRYEDLPDALADIRRRLDLPASVELPRAKASSRPPGRSYRDVVAPPERDRIAEIFAFEIAHFGYEF